MRKLWVKDVPQKNARKPIFGVGVFDGDNSCYSEEITESYFCWVGMLRRCYDFKYHKRKPTYTDCDVCYEWIYFSNFNRWFVENHIKGYQLDKDILVKGNKVYSPDTCCFVPQEINSLILNDKGKRGNGKKELPTGITKSKYSYIVRCNKNGHSIYVGSFKEKGDAFQAYKQVKENHIKQVAQQYFDDGKITEKVYNALMNYHIEITD